MADCNIAQALDLKINANLSYRQIAKIQNTYPLKIIRKIKHLLPTETTKIYQDNRADILSTAQIKLLSSVTDAKLKKISPRDAIVSLGILYDKERLERNLSTDNVSYQAVTVEIHKVDQEIIRLERELARLQPDDLGVSLGVSQDQEVIDVK